MHIENFKAESDGGYGSVDLSWEYGAKRDEVVEIRVGFYKDVDGEQVQDSYFASSGNKTTRLSVAELHPFTEYEIKLQAVNNRGQLLDLESAICATRFDFTGDYVYVVDHIDNNEIRYSGHGLQPYFGLGIPVCTDEFKDRFKTSPIHVQLKNGNDPEFIVKLDESNDNVNEVDMERFLADKKFVSVDVSSNAWHEYPVADFKLNILRDSIIIPVSPNLEDRIFCDDFGYEWVGGIL